MKFKQAILAHADCSTYSRYFVSHHEMKTSLVKVWLQIISRRLNSNYSVKNETPPPYFDFLLDNQR